MSDKMKFMDFKLIKDVHIDPGNICGCIGPQNGQPLCPCRMRHLKIEGGRYVEKIDHGPAPTPTPEAKHD